MHTTTRFYHGSRAELKPGDLIELSKPAHVDVSTHVYLTANLDEAIWDAEIAVGEGPSRVYIVEPIGQVEDVSHLTDQKSPHARCSHVGSGASRG